MRICQVLASSGSGGLEKHVRELCNELSKTEDVTLIAPIDMRQQLSDAVQFIPMNFKRSRYNPFLLWDLFSVLRKGNYDIIHAQANKAVSLLVTLQNYVSGVTVGTIHNSRAKKGRVFRKIHHVIAVSKEASHRVIDNPYVSVVYNGVKTIVPGQGYGKAQLCEQFDLDKQRPLLCAIGRLVTAKGFDLLVAAMAQINANLLIIGDGHLRAELQQQIDTLSLQNRVVMTGYRDDVLDILKGVDGVIISSRNEGFSYVFAEAMLLKKPVLSTDVPVANEFLSADLLMAKEASSIAQKIAEYALDLDAWTEKMQPVFAATDGLFTLDVMTSNTLTVYRNIVAGTAP